MYTTGLPQNTQHTLQKQVTGCDEEPDNGQPVVSSTYENATTKVEQKQSLVTSGSKMQARKQGSKKILKGEEEK